MSRLAGMLVTFGVVWLMTLVLLMSLNLNSTLIMFVGFGAGLAAALFFIQMVQRNQQNVMAKHKTMRDTELGELLAPEKDVQQIDTVRTKLNMQRQIVDS